MRYLVIGSSQTEDKVAVSGELFRKLYIQMMEVPRTVEFEGSTIDESDYDLLRDADLDKVTEGIF